MILYDIIFIAFAIIYLPYLVFTGRCHRDIWQRFGRYPKAVLESVAGKKVIWVHAVSVGEVMASRALCESILNKYPEKRLVISTVTKTGNDVARKIFNEKATIVYLPVDLSGVLRKVFALITPEAFVIIETEIWPNLIIELSRRAIPVVIVNGRISPRSYSGYLKIKFLIKNVLNRITLFLMQSDEYATRIKGMGAPPEKVFVTGNIKFDSAGAASDMLDAEAIRSDLGLKADEEVFIAGSTHRTEEAIVLRAYMNLLKELPGLRLILAPRHIERVDEVCKLVEKSGSVPLRISNITNHEPRTTSGAAPVLILDTMGRLSQLYSIATIVFMGGSLAHKGGQNILEPAVFSKPIIFGPHMFNFKGIEEAFLAGGAARRVKDGRELESVLKVLLTDAAGRKELGEKARALVDANRGATKRDIEALCGIIG